MHYTEDELNKIYADIKSGEQAPKANVVRPIASPAHPDILPEIIVSDEVADVMSVPIRNNTTRAVYARKPSGRWIELP